MQVAPFGIRLHVAVEVLLVELVVDSDVPAFQHRPERLDAIGMRQLRWADRGAEGRLAPVDPRHDAFGGETDDQRRHSLPAVLERPAAFRLAGRRHESRRSMVG